MATLNLIRPGLSSEQKVAAVGAAAATGLNDDLTVILSGAAAVLKLLPATHPARPILMDMAEAGRRAAWTTSRLLQFAKKGGAQPSNGDLRKALNQ